MNTVELIHQKTRLAYNIAADKYHILFHNEMDEKEYDRNFLDTFSGLFKPEADICDAGCGPSGHIAKYLRKKGFNIIGIDISDRCVELATMKTPEIQFRREDIMHMRFPDNHLDGIVSYYSIIHTPKKYISKIFRNFTEY